MSDEGIGLALRWERRDVFKWNDKGKEEREGNVKAVGRYSEEIISQAQVVNLACRAAAAAG